MLQLENLTEEALEAASLADVVESLVARNATEFAERLSGVHPQELASLPTDFEDFYGWRPPDELTTWEAIEQALRLDAGEANYWRAGHLTLGLDLCIGELPGAYESLERGDFLPGNAEVLLAGLFRLAEDASGDRVLASLAPDPTGHMTVYSFAHELGQLGEPESLKYFFLSGWISEQEPEADGRPGQVGIKHFKQLLRIAARVDEHLASARRAQGGPAHLDAATLYQRSTWLMGALWGDPKPALGALAQAPDLTVWARERSLLAQSPLLANYWMLAHYFLGNAAACAEAVAVGLQSRGTPTRWTAQHIQRMVSTPEQACLGDMEASELDAVRQQVRAAALPSQLAPP